MKNQEKKLKERKVVSLSMPCSCVQQLSMHIYLCAPVDLNCNFGNKNNGVILKTTFLTGRLEKRQV